MNSAQEGGSLGHKKRDSRAHRFRRDLRGNAPSCKKDTLPKGNPTKKCFPDGLVGGIVAANVFANGYQIQACIEKKSIMVGAGAAETLNILADFCGKGKKILRGEKGLRAKR